MIPKKRAISTLNFDKDYLPFTDKLRILKTFYLVYTEIFAQILDNDTINLLTANKKQQDAIIDYLEIKEYDPDQLSIFTGIPTVNDRWTVLKETK